MLFRSVYARAGTPPEIVARLHNDIARALKTPELRAALAGAGADPSDISTEQFVKFVNAEHVKWAKVVKAANIKGE